jgi:hypothetical protein
MTTHIDFAVTEVIPLPETNTEGETVDPRWSEQDKVRSALQRQQRLQTRIAAEGFDD